MKRIYFQFLFCLSFFPGFFPVHELSAGERRYALGAAIVGNKKTINLTNSFRQYSPEVFGYAYYFLSPVIAIRPGVRLNYSWMQQPNNVSQSIAVNEYDFKTTAEVTLLISDEDWNYGFTFGSGTIIRSTQLQTQDPIVPSDHSISGVSSLPYLQGQASVTYSFQEGGLEVGPFIRYSHIFSDYRITWLYGLELSFGFLNPKKGFRKR